MLSLQAPLPNIQTTTLLPSPEFNDSESRRLSVEMKKTVDGTKFTYVKKNTRSKLLYTFALSRLKMLEVRAFIQAYFRAKVRITNHKGEVWEGHFVSNPFEITSNIPEAITLEFEAERVFAPAVPLC